MPERDGPCGGSAPSTTAWHPPGHHPDRGNAVRFCHWRQVGRLVLLLSAGRAVGTVH